MSTWAKRISQQLHEQHREEPDRQASPSSFLPQPIHRPVVLPMESNYEDNTMENDCYHEEVEDTSSSSQWKTSNEVEKCEKIADSSTTCFRNETRKQNRQCIDCKKPPQMQCLHCSKYVCMECAQKHVALANEQVDVAQHVLNDKLSVLERLSTAAKERVKAERNRIVQEADAEQNKAFTHIDQLLEQHKKQVQEKNTELSQLSLDEIPTFVQQMTKNIEYISEKNQQLFIVTTTMPKIRVQGQK